MAAPSSRRSLSRLPRGIWALGIVSLLMDTSSELIHSLLPVFLSTVLGAGMVSIGILEGVAEATALITKLFSGAISDSLGRRKALAVAGYGLAAATKPIFPLATSVAWVFGARFVDRIGKGIRGAPRDALVSELVAPELRGAAYGLRQSLDSVGAFLGPLAAVLLMARFAADIPKVMWFAVPPAILAIVVLVVFVREPARAAASPPRRVPLAPRDIRRLPRPFWMIVLTGAVFTLARFSEAFLVLRASDVGLALHWVPAVFIVMNVVYAASATPAGVLADRMAPRALLVTGIGTLVVADLVLAAAATPLVAFAGAALWGLHLGLTQGLLSKLVADAAPADLRGTAFGVFHLVSGLALLQASVLAGVLWDAYGAAATFRAGAGIAAVAAIAIAAAPASGSAARSRSAGA
jgi:MFS family permease